MPMDGDRAKRDMVWVGGLAVAVAALLAVWMVLWSDRWGADQPRDAVDWDAVPAGASAIDTYRPLSGPASYASFRLDADDAEAWRARWEVELGVEAAEGPQRVQTVDPVERAVVSVSFDDGWRLHANTGDAGASLTLAYDAAAQRGYVREARR